MFRLIILLAGAAVFANGYEEKIDFRIESQNEDRFVFAPVNLYSLLSLSSDPSFCLNLTTTAPVNISIGSCVNSSYVGTFATGTVQLTQDLIDNAMDQARVDATICKKKPVAIFIAANDVPATGSFNLFRCVPSIVRNQTTEEIADTTVLDRAVSTWNDRRHDIAFKVAGGETWRARVGLARAVDYAILNDKDFTLCLAVTGAEIANVTFAKCRDQGGFHAYVKSGTNVGLRANLWHMRQEKCSTSENTSDTDWWIKVRSMNRESISGHVSVFSCKEIKKYDGKRLISSTFIPYNNYMGFDKLFAFAEGANQETVYSADIMEIINSAAFNEPGLFTVQMTVKTLSPVSISLSRCRHSKPEDRVLLVANQGSGIVMLEDLRKILNLSQLPKCDVYDSDEALYLRVLSNKKTIGSVRFSLKYSEGNDGLALRTKPVFRVPKGGHAIRDYPVGNVFDQGMVSNRPLAIILETTSNVTISISKCPNSPRYILVENLGSGTFKLPWKQIAPAANDFMKTTCEGSELWQSDYLFVRVDAPHGEAIGSWQLVSLQINGTKAIRPLFVDLDPFFKATDDIQLIKLDKPNATVTNSVAKFDTYQEEIDIRYFVETVLLDPTFKLFFQSERPVKLSLNRCRRYKDGDDGLKITATENKPLTREEVHGLKVLMKQPRCENKSLNGLFVHLEDKEYDGNLEIYIMDNYNPSPEKKIMKLEDLMKMAKSQ